MARQDAGENLGLEQGLVGFGVLRAGPRNLFALTVAHRRKIDEAGTEFATTSMSSRWPNHQWLAGQLAADRCCHLLLSPNTEARSQGGVCRRAYSRRGVFRPQRGRRSFYRAAAHAAGS
jgi:hypothetical protein